MDHHLHKDTQPCKEYGHLRVTLHISLWNLELEECLRKEPGPGPTQSLSLSFLICEIITQSLALQVVVGTFIRPMALKSLSQGLQGHGSGSAIAGNTSMNLVLAGESGRPG
jgi:hypothetical protein